MDKVNFNPFSEILVDDFLRQSGYIGDAFKSFIADFLCQNTAVLGLDVTAQAVANMTVYVKPGRLYQAGSQGQLEVNLDPALSITAAHPTYARIDRICVQYHEIADEPETRNIMVDTVTRQVTQDTVMTRIAGSVDFLVVTGVAAPGPAAPTVPDGWTSIAQINVRVNTTSILQTDITDERPTLKSLMTHTHGGGVDGAPINSNGLVDNSVTDAKIGNRTITDTTTAVAGANTLTKLLSMLGNMIKQITGKSAWYTAPATTLQALSDLIVSTPGANKLLKLDANSKLPADITGNAATATKLATARKINTVPFDGSADINLTPAQIGAAPKGYGVGERLTPLSSGYDLNTLVLSGMYIAPTPTNGPLADSFQYGVIVTGGSLFTSQMLVRFESGKTLLYHRHTVNSGSDWSTWKQIATTDLVAPAGYGLGTTANEYTGNIDTTDWKTGFYYVKSGATGNKPYTYGHLIVMVESAAATIKQIWMTNIMNDMQIRQCVNGVWSNWKQIATTDLITPYGLGTTTTQYLNADLNTMLTTGFFYVNGGSMTNYPTGANINAHLLVIARTSIVVQQTYYAVDGLVYTRACNSGTWSPWKQIATTDQTTYITASGTGTGYNWRKWSNGDIEIFGTAAAVINTAGTVTYPITLSTIKTCIAVQNEKGVPNGYVFRAINITTAKFDYNWDTFTTGQGSGSACVIHYHVVGT